MSNVSGITDCTSRRIKKRQPGVIPQNLASCLQSIHIRPHHGEDLIDLGLRALIDGPQELLLLVPVPQRGFRRARRKSVSSSVDLMSVPGSVLGVSRVSSRFRVHWRICACSATIHIEISSTEIDNYILATAAARIDGSKGPDRPQCQRYLVTPTRRLWRQGHVPEADAGYQGRLEKEVSAPRIPCLASSF